ncbi:MAG: 2-oxo acid dehydrogenase subunit E2 [Actinobacteria bacterium]|nr:2-oxo acid dehydrogenase subunit E2 [Actinomycetota bacterium]
MPTKVTMPQLGETVVEGTIVKWLVQEGEQIERDAPLFEISTDKVDTEVPSPVAGTLSKILVQEGETVNVGTELAEIDDGSEGEQTAEVSAEAAEEGATPKAEEEKEDDEAAREDAEEEEKDEGEKPKPAEEQPVGSAGSGNGQPQPAPEEDRREGAQAPRPPEPRREPAPAAATAAAGEDGGDGGPRSRILSPLVRRLAEEHQIDLGQVRGSGTGGRITKRDIMAFIEGGGAAAAAAQQPAPAAQAQAAEGAAPPQLQAVPAPQREEAARAPAAAAAVGDREEAVPMTHIRKAIAKHMRHSLETSARAWNLVEVNMENIAQLRNRAKDTFKQREGISLTFMPFVARAVCEALLAFPDVNGELRDDQVILKHYVNLGVAVAYEDGLIVPVVKDADGLNLAGLARSINDVAVRARTKKLKPDEVHGGTFTITNPGPFGSIISVPIINQPQCAILAFDAVEKRPVVIDDAIAIRHMVYLSMSWDHRIIDGATAAKFLGRLKENLQTWDFEPELSAYLS